MLGMGSTIGGQYSSYLTLVMGNYNGCHTIQIICNNSELFVIVIVAD